MTIAADFDRIALLTQDLPDKPDPHDAALLALIPRGARLLDAGCGLGRFARLAAVERGAIVTGIDVSTISITIARSRGGSGADFEVADLLRYAPSERFECAVSITALHHVPIGDGLDALLRVADRVIVHDIFATPILRRRRPRTPLDEAWAAHDLHDSFPSLWTVFREARRRRAKVRFHLLRGRYTLVLQAPPLG